MIIDSHVHIFPDKIAAKASRNIGDFYNLPMRYDGTLEKILELGEECGIDKYVVNSVATTEKQVSSINEFIAAQVQNLPVKLIGFATLHPYSECTLKQIDDAIAMGLKGIKLHPDFQRFDIDCKEAFNIYEAIEGRLPLLLHTGDSRTQFSKPEKLVPVLDRFPKLDIIAAHFGGWSEWQNGALNLCQQQVYVDTSSSLFALKTYQVRELIDIFGADNILFGSDYPMWDPQQELDLLAKVPMTDDEREKIMHGNIEKLLSKYSK